MLVTARRVPMPLSGVALLTWVPLAGVGAGQVPGGGSGPVQVKDSPLLLQQIDALQLSLKHLKNENNLLKVRGMGWDPCGMGSMWDVIHVGCDPGGMGSLWDMG